MPETVLAIIGAWVFLSMVAGVLFVAARWWIEHHRARLVNQNLPHITSDDTQERLVG